jgi:hypothetical protein
MKGSARQRCTQRREEMLSGETSGNVPNMFNPNLPVPFGDDSMSDFIVPRDDNKGITRATIEKAAKDSFGGEDELVAKLTDSMMAVSESRERISAEMIALGNQLFHAHYLIRNNMVAKGGDSISIHRKAARMAYNFFESSLKIKESAARQYMRCWERFGNNEEAIRIFNVGELDMLAAAHVTDAEINEIMLAKRSNPDMKRADVKKLLDTLQKQEKALVDSQKQVDNVTSVLEDTKTALDLAQREAQHLKDELDAKARALAAKQQQLDGLDDLYNRRTAGMSDMQKDLADKDREIARLLDEVMNKKPEVQVKEVLVTPPGFSSLSEALEAKTAEFKKTTQALDALKQEVTEVEKNREKAKAALAAAEKVQKTMEGVSAAFESFDGKLTAAQLAVQASDSPAEHRPMFETLSAMMRKSQSELDAWLAK